jgi:hypothetical protein
LHACRSTLEDPHIRLELFLSLISAIFMMLISKKFIERVERKEMTGEVPGTL